MPLVQPDGCRPFYKRRVIALDGRAPLAVRSGTAHESARAGLEILHRRAFLGASEATEEEETVGRQRRVSKN